MPDNPPGADPVGVGPGDPAPDDPARRDAQQVWRSPRELGSGGGGLASLGQGTVAILGGFDLTTVVLLATDSGNGALRQGAIACLGVGAAAFALALAFIASAEDYSATPDDRLMYHPEARVSAAELDAQRGLQRQDDNLLSVYYNRRVLPAVTIAVILTLAGLALTLLGRGWQPGPLVAAGGAVLVALIYLADALLGGNWWLFPRPVLPALNREQLARNYPGRLSRRQRRHKRRDEIVRLAQPRAAMGEDGRAAMLSAPAPASAQARAPRGWLARHLRP